MILYILYQYKRQIGVKMTKESIKALLKLQQGEMTGFVVYKRLAEREKHNANKAVLMEIAGEEQSHYQLFRSYTGQEVSAHWLTVWITLLLSKVFGLTFGLKMLERVEANREQYEALVDEVPSMNQVIEDEEEHEQTLIGMIDEERLKYMSSVVLGLNDALVELTGALAGFTLSIQNARTIALMGFITGISASFSMAASEYLSTRAENNVEIDAKKSAIYTGLAYVATVLILVLPFFLCESYLLAMAVTLLLGIGIIALFNYYVSVVKDERFGSRFLEMASISIGVALISFAIGFLVKRYLGFEI
ncbi:VIT1/CCC1 transporter family protein [Clostridia bacterium]|nr:VIT1/CCC1 transporter family protein [Clostridia bacterium]